MTPPLPPLITITEKDQPPAAAAALQGWPLLRLGFRPFYLGAALLACLSLPGWIALFLGYAELKLEI